MQTDRYRYELENITCHAHFVAWQVIRSSAVAERPRDVSCLSVVCFKGTIPRAQFFIISYFGFRFAKAHNKFSLVVFRVTYRLSVINKIH